MTRRAALLLPLVLLACGDAAAPAEQAAPGAVAPPTAYDPAAFDTVVVASVPLGPEQGAARLVHTFHAAAPTAAVAWTRLVVSGADTLLVESGTSGALDGFFEDVTRFEGCATAETCRRRWFVETFAVPRLDTLDAGPLDAYEREVVRGFLLDEGFSEAEAGPLLDALDAHQSARPRVTVQFTESPVSGGPVWVYHPDLRRLLPVSSDAP